MWGGGGRFGVIMASPLQAQRHQNSNVKSTPDTKLSREPPRTHSSESKPITQSPAQEGRQRLRAAFSLAAGRDAAFPKPQGKTIIKLPLLPPCLTYRTK